MNIVIYIFAGIGVWCTATAILATLLLLYGRRIDEHMRMVEGQRSADEQRANEESRLDR